MKPKLEGSCLMATLFNGTTFGTLLNFWLCYNTARHVIVNKRNLIY
jgi:hypothetical protein